MGAIPPNATAVKFQQNATLVALILVGNDSAVRGFRVPSVIPINTPIRRENNSTKEGVPALKDDINGYADRKIPSAPTIII